MPSSSEESVVGSSIIKVDAEFASKMSADFKIKECPAFVNMSGKQTRGAKVLAFNDSDVPLTVDAFNGKKQVNVGLIVVDCLSDGFSRVPYECSKNGVYKSSANAKQLTEKSVWPGDPEKQLSMLTCWPYGIVEGCPQVLLLFSLMKLLLIENKYIITIAYFCRRRMRGMRNTSGKYILEWSSGLCFGQSP
jgi:hypothetical protein